MFQKIKSLFGSLFLHTRFYYVWVATVLLMFFGYWFDMLFVIGKYGFIVLVFTLIFDYIYLFYGGQFTAERKLPEKLSNGDQNTILFKLQNAYPLQSYINIIDELPEQFQKRDFEIQLLMEPRTKLERKYLLRPVKRGVYNFGKLNVFIASPLRLAIIRRQFSKDKSVKVYPSFVQMRKYELIATANKMQLGVRKVRRLGHTMEFEQIKEYVKGDDYRTINWKTTAKHNKLMVNQYQDEKSQSIYSLIDMGRTMQLPFNNMTLLDYSINSALAFSNIAMKKKDKAGLLTFEKAVRTFIKPDNGKQQLHDIFEALYAVETQFEETDFERLYRFVRQYIPTRSMLMLYANFEHINSLRRQLPFLKRMAKKHLLVVIIFENTELQEVLKNPVEDTQGLYHKIVVEDFNYQKRMMLKELSVHNIQTIYTSPNNLTTATINKYLQLKARGLI